MLSNLASSVSLEEPHRQELVVSGEFDDKQAIDYIKHEESFIDGCIHDRILNSIKSAANVR